MSSEVLPYTVKPHPVTGLYSGKLGLWLFLASEVMLFGALFSTYIILRTGDPNWPAHEDTHLSVPIGFINTLVLIASSVTMVMAWAKCKMDDLGGARKMLAITLGLAVLFLVLKVALEYIPKSHHYGILLQGESKPITGHIESETDDEIVFHLDEGHGAAAHANAADAHDADHAEGDHEHTADAGTMRIKQSDIVWKRAFVPSYSTFFGIYYVITGLHGLHILGGIIVIGYFVGPGAKLWEKDKDHYANRIECTGLYWHFVDLVWIFLFPTFYLL